MKVGGEGSSPPDALGRYLPGPSCLSFRAPFRREWSNTHLSTVYSPLGLNGSEAENLSLGAQLGARRGGYCHTRTARHSTSSLGASGSRWMHAAKLPLQPHSRPTTGGSSHTAKSRGGARNIRQASNHPSRFPTTIIPDFDQKKPLAKPDRSLRNHSRQPLPDNDNSPVIKHLFVTAPSPIPQPWPTNPSGTLTPATTARAPAPGKLLRRGRPTGNMDGACARSKLRIAGRRRDLDG